MQTKLENDNFLRLFAKAAAWLILSYGIGFAVWTIFFTETGNGDNVEHIHATWLVAYGKIPYKDFFQHHNPLLWYVFAPLIRLFANPLAILDAAHMAGIAAGIITFFVVYKISTRFFASGFATLLALLALCPPYYYIYCFNYNPDTFMALCFAVGLYFLLAYWEKKQLSDIVIAFLSFFLAFMFTQKILTVLAPLGLAFLYNFFRQKGAWTDVLYALTFPLLGLAFFLAYLYYNDALEIYWQSNYLFNVKMQEYYGSRQIDVLDWPVFAVSTIMSICSIIFMFKKSGFCYKVIAVLFVLELFQRCFYFSIAPYYLLPLMIFMVLLNSALIDKIIKRRFAFSCLILMLALFFAVISKQKYLMARPVDRSFARYLAANVTSCDYVISSFLSNQSIISKDPHYYWSLLGHVDITAAEMGISPRPDLNQLVLRYKPKLVSGDVYWNNYYLNRGKNIAVQQISPVLLEKYYLPTPFRGLYLLKYEYHGHGCYYDKSRKEWRYAK